MVPFRGMTIVELREWVEAKPGRIEKRDSEDFTPLYAAVMLQRDLSLVLWLLDAKGADVNARGVNGFSPLHVAPSVDIFSTLLDHGADPTVLSDNGTSILMWQQKLTV